LSETTSRTKIACGFRGNVLQNAGDDITLALDRSDDRGFAGSEAARAAALFVPVPPLVLAADIGFINFDNAAKLFLWFNHCRADFMAHAMRGAVRTKTHLPLNLQRANSLFAGRHEMHDLEPLAKRLIRVLKNRARNGATDVMSPLSTGNVKPSAQNRSEGRVSNPRLPVK